MMPTSSDKEEEEAGHIGLMADQPVDSEDDQVSNYKSFDHLSYMELEDAFDNLLND